MVVFAVAALAAPPLPPPSDHDSMACGAGHTAWTLVNRGAASTEVTCGRARSPRELEVRRAVAAGATVRFVWEWHYNDGLGLLADTWTCRADGGAPYTFAAATGECLTLAVDAGAVSRVD